MGDETDAAAPLSNLVDRSGHFELL
jgi:hypothetical protein